ncbi:Ig-like domain-containing protein [Streptomyces sp. NPDC053560]|uniref:L,D-transpeptidase n=1 Tax=Streptomyces sp. NPDC053560 TaxID=3365711 RepID=UPI0037D3CA76
MTNRSLTYRTLRRPWTAAVPLLAGAALLAGCRGPGGWTSDEPPSPKEAVRVHPDDGARGVPADHRIEVRVPDGRLERVEVTRAGDTGSELVPGRLTPDGRGWRSAGAPLALASRYTVEAVALDGHGRRTARHTSFTTYVPEHRIVGFFRPEHRSTVGTGMIISFAFNRPVRDRAAVERAVTVTARPEVTVAPHWFGDRRLDFRPREPWRPGTEVSMALRLRDVRAAPGVYGIQHKTVRFRIGRDRTSVVDATAHTMTVRSAGKPLATLPVTAGDQDNPTYNGRMVILERHPMTRMDGGTVGFGGEYDIPDVPHALRLTTSGTFLHGNYWAPRATFGAANTSHGCVGLRDEQGGSPDTPAGWFYRTSLIGDIVEVIRSRDTTVAPDNGLGGWNMTWRAWLRGSAAD